MKNNYVGKVIFSKNGSIHIQLSGDSLNEGVLMFLPEIKSQTQISYSCRSLEVPTEYIPKDCVRGDR